MGSLFRRNIFKRTYRADHLWLDCGNENNRITQNLFLDGIEQREAVFIECSRDETNLIDNNIFWNIEGRFDQEKIPKEPGSSGWYKLREHDVVNGYGVYGEGTDHLYLEFLTIFSMNVVSLQLHFLHSIMRQKITVMQISLLDICV